MQKEVIYIDVDDDITAIIGKIKLSKEKIVALVPPKRVGVLQSAVNLRLLDRMAKASKKNLVIITNNPALMALTAAAHIPVAKNLQSKPEVAEIPALTVDDGDDIIDGADLPVGDHAKSVASSSASDKKHVLTSRPSRDDAIETLEIDGAAIAAETAEESSEKPVKSAKPKVKIPNFDSFRKRLFIGGFLAAGLVVLLVWMFAIAPAATITITASTQPAPVSASVKLGGTNATDPKAGVISSVSQQLKKDSSVQFDATGKKDKGEKATGVVTFSTIYISSLGTTIPAGTKLTSVGGFVFVTDEAVTITADNYTGADVPVTASESGQQYNGVTGDMSGAPSGISASIDTATEGGTTKLVTIVSDEDIQKALGQIQGQSSDSAKTALKKQFKNGEVVIDSSFTTEQGDAKSSPAKDEEVADGAKATLTVPMTYTIYAFSESAIKTYLDATMKTQIDNANTQQVYDNGLKKVAFGGFLKAADGTMTVTLTTTGQIGPKIDKDAVKNQVKGKITGDVQNIIAQNEGVRDVEVSYSYFWVRKVPNDTNKIQVEFKLKDD